MPSSFFSAGVVTPSAPLRVVTELETGQVAALLFQPEASGDYTL